MAHPSQILYLPSSDPTNGLGDYSNTDVTVYFERPVDFKGVPQEVAMTQLSFFPAEAGAGAGDNEINDSMWVYLNIIDSGNVKVGSSNLQLLAKDLPSKHQYTGGQLGERIQVDPMFLHYVPVMGTYFTSMTYRIRRRAGGDDAASRWAIADDPNNGTTLVLTFRGAE